MARALKLLLVEDNDNDALLFALGVKRLSVSIIRVRDAAEAIQRLSSKRRLPDLIVQAPHLPGMSANEFLEWAKSSAPSIQRIPVVIYTGAVVVDDALKSMVRATFFKSPRLADIQTTVSKMCGLVANEQIIC